MSAGDTSTPTVSVCMITYNHEASIAQAIEGVLMQETNFPVELVIGEDCSTDGTRAVVIDYAQRYPERIRPLLPERNLGMMPNFIATLEACGGKYVALCEGDDYWTDPHKLQKQVKFLEAHPECSICAHRVAVVDETGLQSLEFPPPRYRNQLRTIDDVLVYPSLPTCSLVFRNGLVKQWPNWFLTAPVGDFPLIVLNAQHGQVAFINEEMGAYRRHSGGVWTANSTRVHLESILAVYDHIYAWLSPKHHRAIRLGRSRILLETARVNLNNGDIGAAKDCLRRSIKSAPPVGHEYSMNQMMMFLELYAPRLRQVVRRMPGKERA